MLENSRIFRLQNEVIISYINVTVQPYHSYFARIYIMTKNIISWLAKYSCMVLSI